MKLKELTSDQRRQLIDTQQAFEAWREADLEGRQRFAGGMRWAERGGTQYLLRKTGESERSLGPRTEQTEASLAAFVAGAKENAEKRKRLEARLAEIAPINVAMALGRLPSLPSRILRRMDERGLLGRNLFVVGTNALFAYESKVGVQIESGLLATADIDFLIDARRGLSLAMSGIRQEGLIGLLQKVDRSFAKAGKSPFRATNADGYLVDLIAPGARRALDNLPPATLSDLPDDLVGAGILGLDWLINAPKLETIAIDERGYPVPISVVDPRVFALHKLWLSEQPDRDPVKKPRDREQARIAGEIAVKYLNWKFDAPELSAMPEVLRQGSSKLLESPDRGGAALNW